MFLIKYHKHETSMDTIQYLVVYSVAYSFQQSALVKVLSDFKQKMVVSLNLPNIKQFKTP